MNMIAVGRPTRPEPVADANPGKPGGAMLQDEPLIFELGGWTKTGVDIEPAEADATDLGDLAAALTEGTR